MSLSPSKVLIIGPTQVVNHIKAVEHFQQAKSDFLFVRVEKHLWLTSCRMPKMPCLSANIDLPLVVAFSSSSWNLLTVPEDPIIVTFSYGIAVQIAGEISPLP